MNHHNEVTAANSHAALISEISELRRLCWTLISAGKQSLPALPEVQRKALLDELMRAEKYLST